MSSPVFYALDALKQSKEREKPSGKLPIFGASDQRADRPKGEHFIEYITHNSLAPQILNLSRGNRLINKRVIRRYSADMRGVGGAKWHWNGQPIIISDTGILLTGHHRLIACRDAGVGFWSSIIVGVKEEALPSMDDGYGWTARHHLEYAKTPNAGKVASAAKALMVLGSGFRQQEKTSAVIQNAFLKKHPGLVGAVQITDKGRTCFNAPMLAAWYYMCTYLLKDPSGANEALKVITTGIPFYDDGDPMHALRERYIRMKREPGDQTGGQWQVRWGWTLMACWNAFIASDSVHKVVLRKVECRMDGADYDLI